MTPQEAQIAQQVRRRRLLAALLSLPSLPSPASPPLPLSSAPLFNGKAVLVLIYMRGDTLSPLKSEASLVDLLAADSSCSFPWAADDTYFLFCFFQFARYPLLNIVGPQVQQMLLLMEQNMQQMQEAVLGKLDQMTDRIVQLEQSLNKVMDQAGIDPAQLKAEVDVTHLLPCRFFWGCLLLNFFY